jgi:hypothetical protein
MDVMFCVMLAAVATLPGQVETGPGVHLVEAATGYGRH